MGDNDLPEFWGDADFELIKLENLGNNQNPTVADIRMFGEIRGVQHERIVRFVCSPKVNTYDQLSEEISYNCLYPWVQSIIMAQDAATDGGV